RLPGEQREGRAQSSNRRRRVLSAGAVQEYRGAGQAARPLGARVQPPAPPLGARRSHTSRAPLRAPHLHPPGCSTLSLTRPLKSEGRICPRIESSAASHTVASPERALLLDAPFISGSSRPRVFNKPLDHHNPLSYQNPAAFNAALRQFLAQR